MASVEVLSGGLFLQEMEKGFQQKLQTYSIVYWRMGASSLTNRLLVSRVAMRMDGYRGYA
jgi:hypothetical protein